MTEQRAPRDTTAAMRNTGEMLAFLGDSLSGGTSAAIENQEAAGQREMLTATVIPARTLGCTDDDLTALGFVLGDGDPDDPLFRAATLPDGWTREGTSHDLWTYILDERGRRRCSVFYKAAWYDRRSSLSLISLEAYLCQCLHDDTAPILDGTWAPRDAVLAVIDETAATDPKHSAGWARLRRAVAEAPDA